MQSALTDSPCRYRNRFTGLKASPYSVKGRGILLLSTVAATNYEFSATEYRVTVTTDMLNVRLHHPPARRDRTYHTIFTASVDT